MPEHGMRLFTERGLWNTLLARSHIPWPRVHRTKHRKTTTRAFATDHQEQPPHLALAANDHLYRHGLPNNRHQCFSEVLCVAGLKLLTCENIRRANDCLTIL